VKRLVIIIFITILLSTITAPGLATEEPVDVIFDGVQMQLDVPAYVKEGRTDGKFVREVKWGCFNPTLINSLKIIRQLGQPHRRLLGIEI